MKRRIVLAGRGDGGSATSAPRPAPGSPPRLRGPGDSQSPALGAGRCGGMIWDSLQRDVTLCRGVQAVMPGWGTRFGDAPKGLDLAWGVRTPRPGSHPVHRPPFAAPAAAPGAFPAAGPGSPRGTGTTGAMAGRKVGQEKPWPHAWR